MTLTAVLLAGGESRRMGRDKATMKIGGRPLWERQLELLRALGSQQLFVSARTKPDWLPEDVEVLLDDPPSRGPLGGLTRALSAMRTTHLLALAVDMPFMTSAGLENLVDLTTEDRGVVPFISGRAEPLAAIYPAAAATDFEAALAGVDFSLQAVVRSLIAGEKVKAWAVSRERIRLYQSVNTPSDLAEFNA